VADDEDNDDAPGLTTMTGSKSERLVALGGESLTTEAKQQQTSCRSRAALAS
jgi:hypothetical protein